MDKILIEPLLAEMVRRVVQVAHPNQVILFGSAARNEMSLNSDVDLLVVVENTAHRRRLAQAIYRNLVGVGFAADIVVITTQDLDRYRENPYTVIRPALEEGRVLYAA